MKISLANPWLGSAEEVPIAALPRRCQRSWVAGHQHSLVHLHGLIRPGGGPSGYLYNLRQACSRLESCPIGFAAEVIDDRRDPYIHRYEPDGLRRLAAAIAPTRALAAWVGANARAEAKSVLAPSLQAQVEAADAVVVHDWLMFHHYLNWRARCGQKRQLAILMDHSPRTPSDLVADDWAARWKLPHKIAIPKAEWEPVVLDAFSRADVILVPTRHALDAYFQGEEDKRAVLFARPIVELASGVAALRPKHDRAAVRRELGLDEDAFVVGYLGRYEHEKGYDIYLETAREALRRPRSSNIRFVAAGYGPLKTSDPPSNLIQLGWRQDAGDLLTAFDLLLAPNRCAYFDLVILEAMSLGKTVYTTFVGGSKGLRPGSVIYLHEQSPSALAQEFLALATGERPLLDAAEVQEIFDVNYSDDVFLQRHLDFAGQIHRLAEEVPGPNR